MRITGQVQDRHGAPLPRADVVAKDTAFADLAATTTDEEGRYALAVDVPVVPHLFACRGYGQENLEFWGEALEPCGQPGAADDEVVADCRIGGLEVYRLGTVTTEMGLTLWFRPMSLAKAVQAGPPPAVGELDIAPEIDQDATVVSLDGVPVHVESWQRVSETLAPGSTMPAYLVQVLPVEDGAPAWRRFAPGKHYLHVRLVDTAGHLGEAARVVTLT